MGKTAVRKIIESISKPFYNQFSKSERNWKYKDLEVSIYPGVFNPGWFHSTRVLLGELESLDVHGKVVLEIGCGTGIIACRMAELGAKAYASDILPIACDNAAFNAKHNNLKVNVLHADLFEEMDQNLRFDYVFANPPFEAQYPEKESDFCFCCGELYEYYNLLFAKLKLHLSEDGCMIMTLAKSSDCHKILDLANKHQLDYTLLSEHTRWADTIKLLRFFNSQQQ